VIENKPDIERGSSTDLEDMRGGFTPETADFLKIEFQQLHNAFLSNEEGGERRVNIYFALIAAITAALGLVGSTLWTRTQFPVVLLVTAVIMLLFGLVTLRRLMGRNLHTTELINSLRRIRGAFLWAHPEALPVLPFVPAGDASLRDREGWGIGKAGFVEIIAFTNCIVVSVATGAALWLLEVDHESGLFLVVLGSISLAIMTWFAQLAWIKQVYRDIQQKDQTKRKEALDWWEARLDGKR
jgi:hypothetical protein